MPADNDGSHQSDRPRHNCPHRLVEAASLERLEGDVNIEKEGGQRSHEIKGNLDNAADHVGVDARMGAEYATVKQESRESTPC